jgi:hypothetical protein
MEEQVLVWDITTTYRDLLRIIGTFKRLPAEAKAWNVHFNEFKTLEIARYYTQGHKSNPYPPGTRRRRRRCDVEGAQ